MSGGHLNADVFLGWKCLNIPLQNEIAGASPQNNGSIRLGQSFFNVFFPKNPQWGFPYMGVSQNGWFIMENTAKMILEMDDLEVPPILET